MANQNEKTKPASKPVKAEPGLTKKQIDAIAEQTGADLKAEPTVNLIIPKLEGESDTVECCINGYNYVIKKGEMVKVPRSVADVLRHAGVL